MAGSAKRRRYCFSDAWEGRFRGYEAAVVPIVISNDIAITLVSALRYVDTRPKSVRANRCARILADTSPGIRDLRGSSDLAWIVEHLGDRISSRHSVPRGVSAFTKSRSGSTRCPLKKLDSSWGFERTEIKRASRCWQANLCP
ncbi:hypothetical protein KM043_010175 [Ampulex compressa]|nr:hypothetical protein KM043_010175 [Ampulex compressa]